ncbi:MAG: hypothetical protein ACPKPY_07630 [Nitrososphaeraceae archaeon]
MFDPVYDVEQKTLKYEITPDNATSIELPSEFELNTLIMDRMTPPAFITSNCSKLNSNIAEDIVMHISHIIRAKESLKCK